MRAPALIVLGIDTPIGLAAIRECGRRGVVVGGIARSGRAVGLHSRYLARGVVLDDGEAVRPAVERLAGELGGACLLAVSEGDIRAVHDWPPVPALKPLVPPARAFATVLDKGATGRLAAGLGIDVPETWTVTGGDIAAVVAAARFPAVLKWADPTAAAAMLAAAGLPLVKAEICGDRAALRAALHRYRPLGAYPLVQAYCPGHGIGHMVLLARGRAMLRFAHRRLHEWPPAGGVSTVCESVGLHRDGAQWERSLALLRALGWEGPAMVEYRRDPATGRTVLMEVNGRLWGSLPLAAAAGVPFAWGTYAALGLGREVAQPPYREGLRCRYMVPETRRLLRVLATGEAEGRARALGSYAAGFVDPRSRYYVFQPGDPGPFLADLRAMAAKAAALLRWRLARPAASSSVR